MPKLLRSIRDHCECILADKNYDDRLVYSAIKKYRPTRYVRPVKHDTYTVLIPPQRNTLIRIRKGKYPLERSHHATTIKKHGMLNWQKQTGYGKRSLVETAFSRYKRLFGKLMHSIALATQKSEVKLACKALNIMMSLGMTETVRVA